MAEIIPLPRSKGNGAREALTEIETASRPSGLQCWADYIMMQLWARGFKVVPIAEIEITPEMIAAGEQAILEQVGWAEFGPSFSAPDLAAEIFRAMRGLRR